MGLIDEILGTVSRGLDGILRTLDEEAGRRGSDRMVAVGRRRLDQFKYGLIQLKPTDEVCHELVEFLVDYLETTHVGIYLWDETEGTFSLQEPLPGVRHGWRVFDPFLMYMADHDAIIRSKDSDAGLPRDVAEQRLDFFQQTRSDLIVPLVLNQSLLGILFVGPAGTIEWTPSRVNALNEVRSLVTMALSNSILYARLEGILEHLEEKVKERTRKLEEAQSHLVQSEKMAMLGVMIAGIAHEINTPAGVIFGGSMNLQKNLEAALDLMPSLLDQLGEQTIRSLMQLSMEQSRRRIHVTGAFKKKRELASQLETWIGPSQWITSLSEHLVETGLYETPGDADAPNLQKILQSMKDMDDASRGPLIEFLKVVSAAGKNLSNIQGSIESIVRIVRALKSYSHPGQKTFGGARVEDGLSNTLIILSSVWKGQLEVDKEFGETPEIECDADELNQVWTNLLTNAWQAMKGQSEARIHVSTEYYPDGYSDRESAWQAFVGEVQGPCVCVQIRDNGPGIPTEYLEKIWDPFFTTKDQGEGSGLGLSIVRRIVEEHGGAVGVRSARGTEFCVLLPLMQNEATIKKKEGTDREGSDLKRSERAGGMPRKFQ